MIDWKGVEEVAEEYPFLSVVCGTSESKVYAYDVRRMPPHKLREWHIDNFRVKILEIEARQYCFNEGHAGKARIERLQNVKRTSSEEQEFNDLRGRWLDNKNTGESFA